MVRTDEGRRLAQLPLALSLADHASFATFEPGANVPAVHHVRSVAEGSRDMLFVWGGPGSGKTHLLQAACRAAAPESRAMYVPLRATEPRLLAGLEAMDLLALDDVDAVAGRADWEGPLFVLVNEFMARRGGLLMSATVSAAACAFSLLDLKSRAAGAISYRLEPLSDAHRVEALRRHASERGLELDVASADYLVQRVARDMRSLTDWLDRLDRESLVAQRRLTIPFIREWLARVNRDGGAR
jgi:DnaA family protein